MFHSVQLILTTEIIREFVMSLQVIIYAKQNGAQMATFAATGTRADIDDQRKEEKEDNGCPGNEVAHRHKSKIKVSYLSSNVSYKKGHFSGI